MNIYIMNIIHIIYTSYIYYIGVKPDKRWTAARKSVQKCGWDRP